MDTLEMEVTRVGESAPVYRGERRAVGPQDRPPFASRFFVGMAGLVAMMFTVAVMLSDRAPGALKAVFGDRLRALWERIDASGRAPSIATEASQAPTDFIVHILIWAVVASLVGLAIWTWRGLAIGAVALFASSIFIELAQGRYADTRVVEARDVLANGIGIMLGTVVAAAAYLVWSGTASALRWFRH
jgi:hypothetical protein